MNDLPDSVTDPASQPRDGQAEVVERVVSSRQFARAPRLIALLRFITERHLAGHSHELTEPQIALHVFGRGKGFDPLSDNIVRVTVRQLRFKLKEYYREEGNKETWLVDIPKGGYIPTFQWRGTPVETSAPEAHMPHRWRIPFPLQVLSLVAVAVLGVISTALWRENKALKVNQTGNAHVDTSLVADAVIRPGRKTIVVPPDSGLSLRELLAGRNAELSEYTGEKAWPMPEWFSHPAGKRLWEELGARYLTHATLFSLVQRMVTQNPSAEIILRHPRMLSARDFKDDNFVLLGMTNPWTALFEDRLNFALVDEYPRGPGGFKNRAPAPGEPLEYRHINSSGSSGLSYARVALVPNLSGTGKVLLLTGLGTFKTEAAGDFLLHPGSAALVRQTLGLSHDGPLPGFELLLEAVEINKTGTSARILSWRVHQ